MVVPLQGRIWGGTGHLCRTSPVNRLHLHLVCSLAQVGNLFCCDTGGEIPAQGGPSLLVWLSIQMELLDKMRHLTWRDKDSTLNHQCGPRKSCRPELCAVATTGGTKSLQQSIRKQFLPLFGVLCWAVCSVEFSWIRSAELLKC